MKKRNPREAGGIAVGMARASIYGTYHTDKRLVDEVDVRVLVARGDGGPVVLGVADVCNLWESTCLRLRGKVATALDAPAEHVGISATQNHAAEFALGDDRKFDHDKLDRAFVKCAREAAMNPMARRGYSRDHRSDCKQVCIGLVVSKCGMPLGYEVFAGNRNDVTTLQEIVETMEKRYGVADRIWAVDRGMVSEVNIEFLKAGGRRYIVGTPKSMLRRFERELLRDDWTAIREGLEVKLCASPDGDETFILCRSRDRREKEKAMHARFEKRIEEGLRQIETSCGKRKQKVATVAKRLGKLLGRNSRAAGLFETDVIEDTDGRAQLVWKKVEAWRDWATLSEGCYLLRSNITDWSPDELWTAYIQLTDAEAAFRIHKTDLRIRPIWHQKEDRVLAHILVCFLAYVLWKTLAQKCQAAGLGDEPRRIFAELGKIRAVDVVLPTRTGIWIRKRCITRPTEHQAILLRRLGLELPATMKMTDM